MRRRYVLSVCSLRCSRRRGVVAGSGTGRVPRGANQWTWNGFLFALPLILAVITLTGARWLFMASVIYGTIGLALDISTIVQESLRTQTVSAAVWLSAMTGLFNAALIVVGGNGFLDVDRTSSLRAAPPPSRRSPSSAE